MYKKCKICGVPMFYQVGSFYVDADCDICLDCYLDQIFDAFDGVPA